MRWPFSKKHRELKLLPAEEQLWSVASGESGGGPLILRINESAKVLAGHPALSLKLGFAIPLNQPIEGGLPDASENEGLAAVEDRIAQRVLEGASGIHALTLTNGVMKELVFYMAPGLDVAALHGALREEVRSHDVQCMAAEEPGWETFRGIVP